MSDMHVVPANQEHDSSPACWCGPVTDYVEPLTSARVWVHRRANDLPHYDAPRPRRLGGEDGNDPAGPPPGHGE